jgi:hypothetical protein
MGKRGLLLNDHQAFTGGCAVFILNGNPGSSGFLCSYPAI